MAIAAAAHVAGILDAATWFAAIAPAIPLFGAVGNAVAAAVVARSSA